MPTGSCARTAATLLFGWAVGAVVLSAAGRAEDLPWVTRHQCFAPGDLRSTPDERVVVKGVHTFDAPPPVSSLEGQPTPVAEHLRGAIRRVALPPGKKLIALTFDLCEQPGEIAGYDGEIIDYLRAQGVKATFFSGGKWMRSHAVRAGQLMSDPLFEVGNHSEAHRNLRLLSGRALTEEITAPQRAYRDVRRGLETRQCVAPGAAAAETIASQAPEAMSLFRFPFGACNPAAMDAVNANGFLAIQWDLSTGDPSPAQSANAIADAMKRAKPGSIIIAHANGRGHHTREALPMAIPALKAKGFEFVTVSELLAAGKPEIATSCYDSRPGDTDRYDRLFPLHAAKGSASEPLHN